MDNQAASVTRGEEPVCTVCVANYNGRNVLEACLESIFQNGADYPIEVIVHDDASTDRSADFVREKYPNVMLMESKKNTGFCISNNRMVNAASGQYILLLNNDAELHKGALNALYEASLKRGSCIIGLPQYNAYTGELIDIGTVFDPFMNPRPNLDPNNEEVGMVAGACMWMPKQLWVKLGGFPEWFGSLAEDMYLCCMARFNGIPVVALSKSGFGHRVGSSFGGGKLIGNTLRTTYRRRALSERNKSYIMLLFYPGCFAFAMISIHVMMLIIEGVLLAFIKGESLIWNAIYKPCLKSIVSNWDMVIHLRRNIQKERKITGIKFFAAHSIVPYKLVMLLKYGLPEIR